MRSKIITISIILLVIAGITWKLVSNKKEINENNRVIDRTEIPVSVSVVPVVSQAATGSFELPAVLEAKDDATVSATTSGKLVSLNVEIGSRVNKGQVIGAVDSRVRQLDLEARELTVDKLKTDYQRNQELLRGNAINETAVTDSKYNYETNRIQAEQLRQQISDANIVAPLSGIVTAKNVVQGEFVNVGTNIATIVDVSELKTILFVNEQEVYRLHEGQKATITADVFPGKTYEGEVSYVSPVGDENHNYRVEVKLSAKEAGQLKAGTYVKVHFDLQREGHFLQIPKRALVGGTKDPYVFVASGGKAVKRKIVTGQEIGENIEVISGLQEGDQVISDGLINISDGSNISIISRK